MSSLAFFLNEGVNALSQAALLFFLGVGLTLIFGIMRIVNFAHGALYMLGAFVAYSLAHFTGSFWVALALAPMASIWFSPATTTTRSWRRRPNTSCPRKWRC